MMARVTIQHQCGHTTEETIGETSSAGIGAAVAGLQATDCAACLAVPTDASGDAASVLWGAEEAARNELKTYFMAPNLPSLCAVVEALCGYAAAWEDWSQERDR